MNINPTLLIKTEKIFLQRGFKSVTMDDIARELGISKKTLYLSFKNKPDLINQLLHAHFEREKDNCIEITQNSSNAIEQMIFIQQKNYDMLSTMNPIAMFELQKYYPQAWSFFEQYKNEFILDQILNNLEDGKKAGLYRGELKIEIISRLHLKSIDCIFQIAMENKDMQIVDVLREYFTHYMRGICTEKGLKILQTLEK